MLRRCCSRAQLAAAPESCQQHPGPPLPVPTLTPELLPPLAVPWQAPRSAGPPGCPSRHLLLGSLPSGTASRDREHAEMEPSQEARGL